MIFGKFMVSDTSLRYNLGLDNFVLMETGPVCISSREKGGQLHVCTYYVLVDKSSSVVRLWRYSFTQNCSEEPHASLAGENKHDDANLTEAHASERHNLVHSKFQVP